MELQTGIATKNKWNTEKDLTADGDCRASHTRAALISSFLLLPPLPRPFFLSRSAYGFLPAVLSSSPDR